MTGAVMRVVPGTQPTEGAGYRRTRPSGGFAVKRSAYPRAWLVMPDGPAGQQFRRLDLFEVVDLLQDLEAVGR